MPLYVQRVHKTTKARQSLNETSRSGTLCLHSTQDSIKLEPGVIFHQIFFIPVNYVEATLTRPVQDDNTMRFTKLQAGLSV